jgi:hypothetical protein
MSIENSEIIDFISIDNTSDECVLTISDHLEWGIENNHLLLLQEKLNKYLAFIESGEIFDSYPKSKDRKIRIDLVSKYKLDNPELIDRIKSEILNAGFGFRADVLNQ